MTPKAYVRVSTSDQADSGAGLDAQRAAIADACRIRGWEEPREFCDAGVSGGLPWHQRPALREAVAILDEHGGALVVAKLDRLSRGVLDFADLMARSRKGKWAVVCLDMGVDTSTPAGELMANVLASFAQFERQMISVRTKDALRAKAAAGVRIGRPPRTELTEAEKLISRLRRAGMTQTAIVAALNEAGTPTPTQAGVWSLSGVQRALTRSQRVS